MDLKWYLYYEWIEEDPRGNLEIFSDRESMNRKLDQLEEVTKVVVISGYTLREESIYD